MNCMLSCFILLAVATICSAYGYEEEVDCGTPNIRQFKNGEITYQSTTVGSVVIHKCNSGYQLIGNYNKQICLPSGQWSGEVPTCTVDCGNPNILKFRYGEITYQSTTQGSVAVYYCKSGYALKGYYKTQTCLPSGKWSGNVPTCTVDCGNPNNFKFRYGTITYQSTKVGRVIIYKCNSGYKLIGNYNKRTCLPSGKWSREVPTCTVDCGKPDIVLFKYGEITYQSTTVGSVVIYKCNSGYQLIGNYNKQTCLPSGKWSREVPTCTVDCGNPNILQFRYGEITYQSTTEGSVAIYKCNYGYQLIGNYNKQTCLPSGKWSGEVPTCTVDCGNPNILQFRYGDITYELTTVGSVVTYKCNPGYQLIENYNKQTCLPSGKWSGEVPTCTVMCAPLKSIPYGKVHLTGTTPGSLATYSCDNGYALVVESTRTCLPNGLWNEKEPTCKQESHDGTCPIYRQYGDCSSPCKSDGDCQASQKCCPNSCGYNCETAETEEGYGK